MSETNGLELDEEEAEPAIGRNFKTNFDIPNEYSENILITDSDFILSDRTSAICIAADMNFKSRLEADFKREYQNVEKRMRKACERWVNACLACLQVKDPRKMKFPLKSVESSEFNEVVLIDHQKICMTESGYNQILVEIDHFTKLAEAVPCQTASAEETCDHLITHWISRYGQRESLRG